SSHTATGFRSGRASFDSQTLKRSAGTSSATRRRSPMTRRDADGGVTGGGDRRPRAGVHRLPGARFGCPRRRTDHHQRLRTPEILHANATIGIVVGVNKPGLRERKKQATRDALRLAALRLAALRGWDQVRVEDIAAEAGVSTRTFNNYFTSKEQAFLATAYERAARAEAALAARPADEPRWAAVSTPAVGSSTTEESDLRPTR